MNNRSVDVVAVRDGRWWTFEIPELGTGGQARSLSAVEHEAQGVAAMWLDVEPALVDVNVVVRGEDEVLTEWIAAQRDEDAARVAQARAAARRRQVVRTLRSRGWSTPDTGRVLGISKQRVHQLERSHRLS